MLQQVGVAHAVECDAAGEHGAVDPGQRVGVSAHPEHDLGDDLLDRRGQVAFAFGDRTFGSPRRSAEESIETAVRHLATADVVEVLEIGRERTVGGEADEVLEDGVLVDGSTVGGESHQLVLAGVHPEAGLVGERRVEEAQRVREAQLLQELEMPAPTDADRTRRPFADAVEGQHRRLVEGGWVERRSRMAHVVLREVPALGSRVADRPEAPLDLVRRPQLAAEPLRHRSMKGLEAPGPGRGIARHDAGERGERLLVEHDDVDPVGIYSAFCETPLDGVDREGRVVLETSEAFLLGGADDLAVTDEGGGGVVIEAADPQDVHRVSVPAGQPGLLARISRLSR